MNVWNDIDIVKPEPEKHVIGIRVWPANPDTGVINGVLYDLVPNAIIDRQRGRWMIVTHWAYPPQG